MVPEPSYPIEGGCLCGAVRFEVSQPPLRAGYCHCTRCQRRTGTAWSASARLAPGSLRWLSGEELVKGWKPDDGMEKCFCANCGAHLLSRDPDDPEATIGVRMSAFDRDPGIRPSDHQYVAYAATWAALPDDGLPRYPESRPR